MPGLHRTCSCGQGGRRQDRRNGTFLRRLLTSLGPMDVAMPRTRESGSPAEVIGRYRRRSEEGGLTQARAARLFGVTQPRISDLVRGKVERFSIDALVNMVAASGRHVDISIETPKDEAA